MTTLTFEDFKPGHFGTFGPRRVTREEILAFAAEFDPQPMHLDEAAASQSMLNGLSGSGWHLCSLMMRMLCDGFIGRTASLGSPGVNDLRWLAPLRPGDELTLDVEVAEARVSKSRPETGIVTFRNVARNAAGQALCEMVSPIIVRRRDAGDRRQQHDEAAERADRHRGEAGENAGNAEQHDQADHQPVKRLDDRGRDETVPLKQILKIEHRSFPQLSED